MKIEKHILDVTFGEGDFGQLPEGFVPPGQKKQPPHDAAGWLPAHRAEIDLSAIAQPVTRTPGTYGQPIVARSPRLSATSSDSGWYRCFPPRRMGSLAQ